MGTVTKKELIERVSGRAGTKRAIIKRAIQEFLDQIILELKKGNRIEFRDFGVFEVKERAARLAQNPKTLERVEVPAKRTVKFKVGRLMKDSVENFPPQRKKPEAKDGTVAAAPSGGHSGGHVEVKPEGRKATTQA